MRDFARHILNTSLHGCRQPSPVNLLVQSIARISPISLHEDNTYFFYYNCHSPMSNLRHRADIQPSHGVVCSKASQHLLSLWPFRYSRQSYPEKVWKKTEKLCSLPWLMLMMFWLLVSPEHKQSYLDRDIGFRVETKYTTCVIAMLRNDKHKKIYVKCI